MASQARARAGGRVFDEIADAYDRHRPGYPDALIDEACGGAAIGPGAAVLELGCGTGQLTRSLLARGLRVTAVEPGRQLIARARERLDGLGAVRFVNARLEDASLPAVHYRGAFCASAMHWLDPDMSWRAAADALVDGGTLVLVSHFGIDEPGSASDQQALRAALAATAPEMAAEWPVYRDLNGILTGVEARRRNVSEAWAWLTGHDIARGYAATLFDEARVTAIPEAHEHTADALTALLGTMSFWSRLSAGQRDALAAEIAGLHRRLGRPIRSSTVACVVAARRRRRGGTA